MYILALFVLAQSFWWGQGVDVSRRSAPSPIGRHAVGIQEMDPTPCLPAGFEAKKYDVLVIGYGGRMATGVETALKTLKSSEEMNIAWLMHKDLEARKYQLALRMGAEAIKASENVFEADIEQEPEKLFEFANQSRVILNLVSPSGPKVADSFIHTALLACSHYVDLSTETKWNREVYNEFHYKAALRHTAIVQAAGFDSVASDLLAVTAASDLVKSGHEAPTHVMVIWELVNTMRYIAKEKAEQLAFQRYGPVMDAYILAPEVPVDMRVDKAPSGYVPERAMIFKPLLNSSIQRYVRATADCSVIRRSMHSLYHDSAISVQEVCATSLLPTLAAFRQNKTNPALAGQPGPAGVRSPEPSPDELEAGSFMGTAIAVRKPNATAGITSVPWTRVMLEGFGDAHYLGTPKIVLQVVAGLVFDGPKQFGYVTPTMALGAEKLEQRISEVDGGYFARIKHAQQ